MDLTNNKIAVILIHGIGDIKRTDVLESASRAIRNLVPTARIGEATAYADLTDGAVMIDAVDISLETGEVKLVEFYWANAVGKIRLWRPLQSLAMVLELFSVAPMLAVLGGNDSMLRYVCAKILGAWFYLSIGLLPLIGIAALAEEVNWWFERGRSAPFLQDFTRSLILPGIFGSGAIEDFFFPILIISVLLSAILVLYWLITELLSILRITRSPHLAVFGRVMLICTFLAFAIMVAFVFFLSMVNTITKCGIEYFYPRIPQGVFGPPLPRENISLTDSLVAMWPSALGLAIATCLVLVLVNLIRDVIYYLAPDEIGEPRPHQADIQDSLWKLVQQLQHAGMSDIILVAHSLGTVILIDTLLRHATDSAPRAPHCALHLVTAGSPIRRLVQRLLPNRMKQLPSLLQELAGANKIKVVSWINTYRVLDYVGQALSYSALLRCFIPVKFRESVHPSWFKEFPLEPQLRYPYFHANYWGDSRFVNLVVRNAIAPLLQSQ